ncbi:MAG TPA: hypothetical protein VGF29_08560, partial [Hyphomicrobiaceae bacterium]
VDERHDEEPEQYLCEYVGDAPSHCVEHWDVPVLAVIAGGLAGCRHTGGAANVQDFPDGEFFRAAK